MLLGDDAGPLCGCLYEGEAADGAPHGYGTLVYASGSMYEGGFVRGRESGKGVLSDGDDVVLYQGDMADGAFNGNGELAELARGQPSLRRGSCWCWLRAVFLVVVS
jgi:hypothetical protein